MPGQYDGIALSFEGARSSRDFQSVSASLNLPPGWRLFHASGADDAPSWLRRWDLLDLFLLEKALYEICYEAANRPSWIEIPLKGVTSLLELEATRDDWS